MKNFIMENWYKLMIGSSTMMASFGFMIYAISPAYSNSDKEKLEIKNRGVLNEPNGVVVSGVSYFVDGGYMYSYETENLNYFISSSSQSDYWYKKMRKTKLP